MEFTSFTLPNGIRCIHKRVPSAVAHCALTVGAGSRDELLNEHGIAHLTEHALFKGTTRRKAHHINSRLENLGGELNAFTTKEDTTIHATTLRGDFSKAAELIADVVFNSVFPRSEIELEKQVVVDEINSYLDIPQELIFDDFEARMFGDVSLGRNIVGSERSIGMMDGAMIGDFVRRTYTTDQMVFSAIGAMSESVFRRTCERHFGPIERRTRKFVRHTPPPARLFDSNVTKSSAHHQTHAVMGRRAYSLSDERRMALSLLVNILGGPAANSRLNTVIRERNGLSYTIDAAFTPFSDTGFVYIYFGCEKRNFDRCRELVLAELDRLVQSPLTARQLSAAKKQFVGQCTVASASDESYMLSAAKSLLVHNRVTTTADVAARIDATSAEELLTIAREIFGTPLSSLIYF